MRSVNKNFNNPPASLSPNNLDEVIDRTNPLHRKRILQATYGNVTVVNALKRLYRNKCAYCDCYDDEPEVEHYRPKKGVTGQPGHDGYYWLCYEWSNLLPACHDCNKTRSKGNHFPVVNNSYQTLPVISAGVIDLSHNRLDSHTLSQLEVPLLLNPEFPGFDPFHYFKISNHGQMAPNPHAVLLNQQKAETTISKIRLNRDKLSLVFRKREIRYFMKRLKGILIKYLDGRFTTTLYEEAFIELLREIQDRSTLTDTSEHWFFWNYFNRNFKVFITRNFNGRTAVGLCNTYDAIIALV
ncbi:hypothetical protein [Pedobacter xixiisoli]|uniref:TIGR02646 family protein n=1 Tax=Pedobacter xixiisoli TaxID=1476464 RepID=A0A286A7E5_9SPHI|nr:hypothetical protein [Pedobacter xixiisoli]SOD17797.1 TIGR02646 family protein [Pedobacter xixiisoli]